MRAALVLLAISVGFAQTHKDVIRTARTYQEIENFGASDGWRIQKVGGWSDEGRNRVADLLFSSDKGIGLSCWRFNIGAGIDTTITEPWRTVETLELSEGVYDWTRQKNERWFLAAARDRGVRQFLAFVCSPPARMTRNGHTYASPGPHTTNLKAGYEGQFGRYLADILEHFHLNPDAAEKVDFNYISPVNEPQWDWEGHSQEGNRSSNDDVKLIIRSLAAELQRRRLPTQIAVVESGNIPDMYQLDEKMTAKYGVKFGDYLSDLAGDPAIAPALSHRIGYHSYWSDSLAGQLVEHRQALGDKMQLFPGWKLWQTEYCVMDGPLAKGGNGRDLGIDTALDVARVIHYDLTLASVSAWHWWTAVSEADYKDGLVYTDWKKPGDAETVYPSKLLWVLGHYSRFVRPGMRRVELAGDGHDPNGVLGSAYVDLAARRVVAVYLNESGETHTIAPRVEALRDWRLSGVSVYRTTAASGDDLRLTLRAPRLDSIELPARSATTLVFDFGLIRRTRPL